MVQLTSEFIKGAQDLQAKTGIPASITLAQLMQESGGKYAGGLSGLAYKDKNLFGVKGKGTAGSSYYPTKEFVGGKYITVQAGFRKYNSFSEAFTDRGVFLSGPRYQKAFANAKTVNDYAHALKSAGYATDPGYANKLLNTISKNNLNQYDGGNFSFTPIDGSTITEASGEDKNIMLGGIVLSINKIILILLFLILSIIFFMKAFPATDGIINNVGNKFNPKKKSKKGLKKDVK